MLRKAPDTGISAHRGPTGEPGGNSIARTFEKRIVYLGSFLRSRDTGTLSLGAIGKFRKGTGLSGADIRLWGTKGQSIRSWCIGTIGAQTQCKSNNESTKTYFHFKHLQLKTKLNSVALVRTLQHPHKYHLAMPGAK